MSVNVSYMHTAFYQSQMLGEKNVSNLFFALFGFTLIDKIKGKFNIQQWLLKLTSQLVKPICPIQL